MDHIEFFRAFETATPAKRPVRARFAGALRLLLVAVLMVVAFAALLLLDRAGIHLPPTDELAASSPVD